MLVLSRRADQQIVFPNLDIKVQVLQVKGKVVKLGIEAPRHLKILRPEVCAQAKLDVESPQLPAAVERHALRNRLNTISLGLRLFQKQSERGMASQSEETFQRVIDELQALDREVGAARTQVKQAAGKKQLRLLVVEDDANERELLAGLLRLHGFEVATAEDGQSALNYLDENALPDFVLLDMNMPRVDGPETLRRIRDDSRLAQLTVYGVSGAEPGSLLQLEDNFNGWFPKPLDPARLIRAMSPANKQMQTLA